MFEAHLGPVTSTYGEVFWTNLPQFKLPQEVIELASKQSSEFEERLKRANQGGEGEASAMMATSRDMLYFYFDRLVSVVSSEMSLREKASVATDIYDRYKASILGQQ